MKANKRKQSLTYPGAISTISLTSIPTALAIPESSVQIWHNVFYRGSMIMPPTAIAVASSYLWAAYDAHSRQIDWKGYAIAAGLVVSIIPFTFLTLGSINSSLIGAAKGTVALSKEQSDALIGRWGFLNVLRSLFPLAGAVTGFITLLNNVA